MPLMRSVLGALPDDILSSIAQRLYVPSRPIYARSIMGLEELTCQEPPRSISLISLSMTCIRLRTLYEPIIFRVLLLKSSGPAQYALPSPRVGVLVQMLQIQGMVPRHLDVLLSLCSNIRQIRCTGTAQLPPRLFSPPTLEIISFDHLMLIPYLPLDGILACPLRVFRLLINPRWNEPCRPPEEADRFEHMFVRSVLSQTRSTLEDIVLPGESTPLSLLASAPWPCLRELALYGAHPDGFATIPLVRVLYMMPNLRVLTLAIAPRRCDPPLMIWPPSEGALRDKDPIPGHLERVTIAFPSADDLIFAHMPGGVTELSLRDAPRFSRRVLLWIEDSGPDAVPLSIGSGARDVGFTAPGTPLSPSHAVRVLTAVPDCTGLLRLELVVQAFADGFEADMYATLARACPRLRFLELHRYRADVPTQSTPIPLDAVASSLAALTELRDLRLNLDFPEFNTHGKRSSRSASLRFAEDNAERVAMAIPALETVALLEKEPSIPVRWLTWLILRSAGGGDINLCMDEENSKLDWDE